jgi:anti-anti-sigma regulatory factor
MSFKFDTKEKFTVIKPEESHFTANMADQLTSLLQEQMHKTPPHVILNFERVTEMDPNALDILVDSCIPFRRALHSLVVCCLQPHPYALADAADVLETLNYAPTESEAWDIVQMEEMEREFLADDENNEIQ